MVTTSLKKPDLQSTPADNSGRKIVIAVDGPAASGKGTLARKMAERFGYAYLDTGALYRAVAMAAVEIGADPSVEAEVLPALNIILRNLTPELLANPALRTAEIGAASSKVAAIPAVRQALFQYQKDFAKNPPGNVGGAILDGRDIGTVICPDADIKFFVTASAEERARRRFKELEKTGITYDQVLEDLRQRDLRDSTRKDAPTRVADDAHTLDTTTMNAADTLDEAIALLKSRLLQAVEG